MSISLRFLFILSASVVLLGQQPAVEKTGLPRVKWLANGMINAGGTHEPYSFEVRKGGMRRDAREQYNRFESEETIRKLKEQGVEVFHTHLYKGFGMAHEKSEMEDAKRSAEIAHRYGLKVDSYIQWNTLMYETFFLEEPRAQDWVQRNAIGEPIMLVYGFQQSFRYRPCFSNPEYRAYLKKIVRYGVQEVKTDFIHFDNFDLNPEPDSCHCQYCKTGFRNYLLEKYTPAKRRERFGFENMTYVDPPRWNRQNKPEDMRVINDPVIQEWIDFRCQTMTDALKEMALYARSMNPEVAIEVNPHGITGGNRAWEAGLDHARFLKWTDAFWTEEENEPGYLDDGRLITKIRSYKLARTFQNILLAYIDFDPIAMAESLAFNQTLGFIGFWAGNLAPEMLRYTSFYRKHRELYTGTKDVATVAVLRSYPSITYNQPQAQLSAILAEQALIQAHVPFDLIFDEHLADLSKYKVLILPDSECLSDEQLASIRGFVEKGGGLVATGSSGRYDEWRRMRVQPGLHGLIDARRAASFGRRARPPESSSPTTWREYGKGRVAHIPTLRFDGPLPPDQPYFEIGNQFWRRPANWQALIESVEWAANGDLAARVTGPEYLAVNLVSQAEPRRMLLHLVNYNARSGRSTGPVAVTCRLPSRLAAKEVSVYSPDLEAPVRIEVRNEAAGVTFTVPDVKVYSIAVVNW